MRNRESRGKIRAWSVLPSLGLVMLGLVVPAFSAEVSIFRLDERKEFLEGERRNVSVEELGGVGLAAATEELATLEEPYVFSAAVHPEGWVVGTGNNGKVLKIDRRGGVEEVFSAPEREVFAVAVGPDGSIYAGTSPYGKVYRIRGSESEPYFDPGETYIWDLAWDEDGHLLVATGLSARLFRVTGEGKGKEIATPVDHHLRSVLPMPGGRILLGTAGQGLVLSLEEGNLRTLYDAAQPEVVDLVALPDGSARAAILASEASLVKLNKDDDEDSEDEEEGEDGEEVKLIDEDMGSGSRSASFDGARSLLVSISPAGEVEELLSLDQQTIYSLRWARNTLWIGTGLDGYLYRYADDSLVLERDFEAKQIAVLLADEEAGDQGLVAVSTNGGSLLRLPGALEERGSFTSSVLDAGTSARFGSFYWRGETPGKSSLALKFRSGMSAKPDQTWTPWSEPVEGREISLSGLSVGRYVQWRAVLQGSGESTPRLRSAELSYRQENQAPRIKNMEVLDAGKILVPSSFNPQSQAYEPWSPNKDGIFTSLQPAEKEKEGRLKGLWKVGYRTLRWKADDANRDRLRYRLSFRPEAEAEAEEWLPMVEDLRESYFSFDSTVLPDGYYRFRLEAVDRPPTEASEALTDTEISEPVVVDHTPPELLTVEPSEDGFVARLRDPLSPLRRAEQSIDGGAWRPVLATDGLVDGRTEELRVEAPAGSRLVLLRVMDAALNSITYDLSRSP